MDNVNEFFATLSSFLWGWPMIVLLLGTHIFLTIRLRFPQRKLFTAIRLSVQRDKSQKGDVSQFGALATALAATIGTGNMPSILVNPISFTIEYFSVVSVCIFQFVLSDIHMYHFMKQCIGVIFFCSVKLVRDTD